MNARSVSSILLVLLAGCASDGPALDATTALGSGRVVLVPLNLGIRATTEVESGVEPVWREILSHFVEQKLPTTALERASAQAAWNEVMVGLRAQSSADVYSAYAQFARRIAEQLDYTAIVFPSLVTRSAPVNGGVASWDGVRRRVDFLTPMPIGSTPITRGEIAAASLHVVVFSPDGTLRFEGAGGLSVLQQLAEAVRGHRGTKIPVELRENAFGNADELREGIEVALRRPLRGSRAH